MTPLWQWLTEQWRAHHLRKRAALLALVQWHERWGEQQAVHVPSQVDTRGGRLAEEVGLLLTPWW